MLILETPKLLKLMSSQGQAHLGFIILVNKKTNIDTIRHEAIHIHQQRVMLVVFWYLAYMLQFLWKWKYKKDVNYLLFRKPFAWLQKENREYQIK